MQLHTNPEFRVAAEYTGVVILPKELIKELLTNYVNLHAETPLRHQWELSKYYTPTDLRFELVKVAPVEKAVTSDDGDDLLPPPNLL